MDYDRFIWLLLKEYSSDWFTASDVQDILTINRQHIYTKLYKCWRMGLLNKQKIKGHRNKYRVSNWGKRYTKSGYLFNRDMVYVKLLEYIILDNDFEQKEWAKRAILPYLMQRFLKRKRKQEIIPRFHMLEVKIQKTTLVSNYMQRRHEDPKSFQDKVEKLKWLYHNKAIEYMEILLKQLHPEK